MRVVLGVIAALATATGCGQGKLVFEGFWCQGIVGAICPVGSACEMPDRILGGGADEAGACVVEDDNTCATAAGCPPGYECAESSGRRYCKPEKPCGNRTDEACDVEEVCKKRIDAGRLNRGYCVAIAAEVGQLSCTPEYESACAAPLTCVESHCELRCPDTGCPTGTTCWPDGAGNQLCMRIR
ncbi:MAG TPA: hypothetical protein VGK67_09425 [Myxococcales bacterium]